MTIQGKQVALPITDPTDVTGAFAAFQAILQGRSVAGATVRPEPVSAITGEYLDSISHRIAADTRKNYAAMLKRFNARFGDCAAEQIEPCIVEKQATNENWSDSHRANYIAIVQSFIRWTGRKDFAMHKPAKESRGADSIIAPDTYARLLRETRGDFHQLCRLMWSIGCRPMEAASLTVDAINWEAGTAVLKKHKNKRRGKKRALFFTTDAMLILREQTDKYGSGPLFRGIGDKQLTRHAIVCRFLRVSGRLKVKVRAYDFRHSYITRALMQGVPAAIVAALVGTSIGMIEKFYGHCGVMGHDLKQAAEKIAG